MNPVKVSVYTKPCYAVHHAILTSDTNHLQHFRADNSWESDLFRFSVFIWEACRLDSVLKSEKCD